MRVPPMVCLCFFPGVFVSSSVTGACPVTTDLIIRVKMRDQQQQHYAVFSGLTSYAFSDLNQDAFFPTQCPICYSQISVFKYGTKHEEIQLHLSRSFPYRTRSISLFGLHFTKICVLINIVVFPAGGGWGGVENDGSLRPVFLAPLPLHHSLSRLLYAADLPYSDR